MKIKRLFIKDFGIFHNELLEDIAPGLVVIGGHNRAGKTTFMELLRYLPFGFPRKKKFITARNRHEVEATVSINNDEEINIYLQGYSAPVIKGSKEIASTSELYNQLDPFTYQQLFTISLDELQYYRFSNSEKERLHSILLGAGLREFILVPQLEDFFYKEAERIGGKLGDPKVKEFKPHYQMIREGVKLQEEASRQLTRFHEKKEELRQTEIFINENEEKKKLLEDEVYRLDILKNNYHLYTEIEEIRNSLNKEEAGKYLQEEIRFYPEKARDILDRYNKKQELLKELSREIKEKYGVEISVPLAERISSYSREIEQLREKVASIREKISFYFEREDRLKREENELKARLLNINKNWQGEIDEIASLEIDQIQLELLQQNIDEYNKIKANLEREKDNLQEYQERRKELQDTIEGIKVNKPSRVLNLYFLGSLIFIVAGFLLARQNLYFGLFSPLGIIGLAIYALYKYTADKNYLIYQEKSKIELQNIELRIKAREARINDYMKILAPLEEELAGYRKLLNLDAGTTPEFIKDYYRILQESKARANYLNIERRELKQSLAAIEKELKDIVELINKFPELMTSGYIDLEMELYLQDQRIFSAVEDLCGFKDNILALIIQEREKGELQEEIKEIYASAGMEIENVEAGLALEEYMQHCEKYLYYTRLNEKLGQLQGQIEIVLNTEAARKAMNSFQMGFAGESEGMEDSFQKFVYLYNQFPSVDRVEESYNAKRRELDELIEELEREKNRLVSIQRELDELATDEALKKSALLIDEGRKNLSILAEEYAVKKTAAFILKKVREIFIQQTRDKLLAGASKYFREITRGEYKAILPTENILESDFQAILKDGTIQESIDLLSRGTLEQLFLAIRISRIKEIEPALPVIVDDSFVNFDSSHLMETLTLIRELANTHQIFLLTCHPHLVESCQEDIPIQYWRLEKGRFSRTSKEELVDYLSVE